jgi:hypothetical protein
MTRDSLSQRIDALLRCSTVVLKRSKTTACKTFPVLQMTRVLVQDLGRLPMPLARSEIEVLTNSRWPRL